jgi:hypothetical protein
MKIKHIIGCGLICISSASLSQEIEKYTKFGRARICSVVLTEAMNSAAVFASGTKDKEDKNQMIIAANIFLTAKNYWDMVFLAEGAQGHISVNEYKSLEDVVRRLYIEKDALRTLTKESVEFCVEESEGTES